MSLRAPRSWLPWFSPALLACLCGILAVLQYRWTGEIAEAQRTRLREELQSRVIASSHAFNDNISTALRRLIPSQTQLQQSGREAAWSAQYLRWRTTHANLLKSAGIETGGDSPTAFFNLDLQSGRLQPAEPPRPGNPGVFEVWRTGAVHQDRLLVELDLKYLRDDLLRAMLNRYLAIGGNLDYDVEVVTNDYPAALIYTSAPQHAGVWETADASAPLLDVRPDASTGRPLRFDRGPRPPGFEARGNFAGEGRGGPPQFGGGPGRWRLLVRHKSGSLEALVARTQRRNLAVSAAVLLLILGTVAMLIRYTRHAQRLAELQMNFVTGVSHELRTPLTVIRTAAYNLRNPRFRRSEEHVERYGRLIEAESGKLEGLVEQVMRFASANAGHAVRDRELVSIAGIIEAEIAGMRGTLESRGVTLDERIDADLPVVMADAGALRQALRNLLDNALKYGIGNSRWIGVSARPVHSSSGDAAEISVTDKGPGIPADEQARIFDAFFRGRRAVQDQVHGTGLGLNLVKTIVEAHAGWVRVRSDAATGTQFVIQIPAAAAELQAGVPR